MSRELSRSKRQTKENKTTSARVGIKKTNKKNKTKANNNKRSSRTTKPTRKTKEIAVETERVLQDLGDSQDSDSQYSQSSTSASDNSNLENVNDTERSILRERDSNEQEVQVDNVEQSKTFFNNTNDKTSFIWNYLEKLPPSEKHKRRVRCLVLVATDQICGHIMGTDGSTGNFIQHLAKHRVTRDADLSQYNHKETQNCDLNKKNRLDKKFVGIIVKDDQPLSIRNDEGFREFVKELDPFYELPSDKKIKELLVNSYNHCKKEITCLFEKDIISCSLTLDLWTSRSRAGYLGVTCSFVNSKFELCEATLVIKYLKYPHTSDIIVECLNQVIQEWNLDGKVFTITTDNGSNMVKAGKLLKNSDNITRFPCAAHTLQLVVGKGLLPAERLIARAKRLINFFTSPKQTEKLIDIQKNMKRDQDEVNFIFKMY